MSLPVFSVTFYCHFSLTKRYFFSQPARVFSLSCYTMRRAHAIFHTWPEHGLAERVTTARAPRGANKVTTFDLGSTPTGSPANERRVNQLAAALTALTAP